MRFKTAYDPVEEHDHCGIEFTMPSLAVQDEKDETDINYIVNKYADGQKGIATLDLGDSSQYAYLQFGDATLPGDYSTALELVSGVREEFYSLPAYVRAKFGHDPMNFISQLNNPETLDYLQREGLYGSKYTFDESQQSVNNEQTQEKSNTLTQNNENTQK
jgi:phage internal scaffolding protein|nr:MAG TPA: Scaffold protein [Microviridae sp.]